jgi:hypothetical protein
MLAYVLQVSGLSGRSDDVTMCALCFYILGSVSENG